MARGLRASLPGPLLAPTYHLTICNSSSKGFSALFGHWAYMLCSDMHTVKTTTTYTQTHTHIHSVSGTTKGQLPMFTQ